MINPEGGTGIKVIPPLVYATGFLIGFGLERTWPLVDEGWTWTGAAGIVLLCASLLCVGPAIWRFRRASTSFDVRKSARALVTEGPYRFTRNPQYVGLTLLYVGLVLLTENVWAFALLLPVLVVMTYAVIQKEEAHLETKFGDEYRAFTSRVRRWL